MYYTVCCIIIPDPESLLVIMARLDRFKVSEHSVENPIRMGTYLSKSQWKSSLLDYFMDTYHKEQSLFMDIGNFGIWLTRMLSSIGYVSYLNDGIRY